MAVFRSPLGVAALRLVLPVAVALTAVACIRVEPRSAHLESSPPPTWSASLPTAAELFDNYGYEVAEDGIGAPIFFVRLSERVPSLDALSSTLASISPGFVLSITDVNGREGEYWLDAYEPVRNGVLTEDARFIYNQYSLALEQLESAGATESGVVIVAQHVPYAVVVAWGAGGPAGVAVRDAQRSSSDTGPPYGVVLRDGQLLSALSAF